LCGLIHRVKLKRWLNTSPKLSEMCRLPGNHCAQTKPEHPGASYQWALPDVWLSTRLDTRTRQRVSPAGRHCSSFITLKLFVFRSGRIKAVRNDPKCQYSRLYRAGVCVPVVAQPIQDMSALSITHKTVGIGLPRLRCGAIGLVSSGLRITQNGCLLHSSLCTWWWGVVGGVAEFSSLRRKRSEGEQMKRFYAAVPTIIICNNWLQRSSRGRSSNSKEECEQHGP